MGGGRVGAHGETNEFVYGKYAYYLLMNDNPENCEDKLIDVMADAKNAEAKQAYKRRLSAVGLGSQKRIEPVTLSGRGRSNNPNPNPWALEEREEMRKQMEEVRENRSMRFNE